MTPKQTHSQTPAHGADFDSWMLARYRALLQEGKALQTILLQKGVITRAAIVTRRDLKKGNGR